MPAGKFNFINDFRWERGSTLYRELLLKDSAGVSLSLANVKARMQVRSTVTSTVKLLDLTTENGGLAIVPNVEVNGVVYPWALVITQTPAQTALFKWLRGVYDIELENLTDGTVVRILEGEVETSPEVTR